MTLCRRPGTAGSYSTAARHLVISRRCTHDHGNQEHQGNEAECDGLSWSHERRHQRTLQGVRRQRPQVRGGHGVRGGPRGCACRGRVRRIRVLRVLRRSRFDGPDRALEGRGGVGGARPFREHEEDRLAQGQARSVGDRREVSVPTPMSSFMPCPFWISRVW